MLLRVEHLTTWLATEDASLRTACWAAEELLS
jgi:hypothetical protein